MSLPWHPCRNIRFKPDVSAPRASKNRLTQKVTVAKAERARLTETLVRGTVIGSLPRLTVIADPEGNGLCLTEGSWSATNFGGCPVLKDDIDLNRPSPRFSPSGAPPGA